MLPIPNLQSRFSIRDKVKIDDSDVIGIITAITMRHDGSIPYYHYEVEWLHNGINQSHWVPGSRLTHVASCKNDTPG